MKYNFFLLKFLLSKRKTGVAGFEPTNGGVKVRSLTTWRHPKFLKFEANSKKLNCMI